MQIRIIATPPGEAPLKVREAWRGVVLDSTNKSGPSQESGLGVLSGPRGFFNLVRTALAGRLQVIRWTGYVVKSAEAVAILERSSPSAALWWRENAPHVMAADYKFVFPAEACEPVSGPR